MGPSSTWTQLHAAEWMASGALRSLSKVDTSKLDERLLPYFELGGQTYALPQNCHSFLGMVVNRELLDKAGLNVPTTWDELWAVAEKLRSPDENRYGVALTPGLWNYVPFLYQAGGALYDPETGAVVLDSPAATEAMEFYAGLYQKDLAYPGVSSPFAGGSPYWGAYSDCWLPSPRAGSQSFSSAPACMIDLLDRMGRSRVSPYPVEVYDLPAGPKGQANIGMVRGFAVLGKSDQPISDATRLFLEYVTGPDAARFWVGEENDPPVYIPAAKAGQELWLAKHKNAAAFWRAIEFLQPQGPYPVNYSGAFELESSAEPLMIDVMKGALAPADAVRRLDEIAKTIVDRYRVGAALAAVLCCYGGVLLWPGPGRSQPQQQGQRQRDDGQGDDLRRVQERAGPGAWEPQADHRPPKGIGDQIGEERHAGHGAAPVERSEHERRAEEPGLVHEGDRVEWDAPQGERNQRVRVPIAEAPIAAGGAAVHIPIDDAPDPSDDFTRQHSDGCRIGQGPEGQAPAPRHRGASRKRP